MKDISYSGEFSRVHISAKWLERPPSDEIFAFQCQETTPTTSFACEIPVRGSFPIFNFRVDCSALEKRKNLHHTKFPTIFIRSSNQVSLFFLYNYIQWNLHKTDTIGEHPFGRYREANHSMRQFLLQ